MISEALKTKMINFCDGVPVTALEKGEILQLLSGSSVKESASAANLSWETIRARRKRLYQKFGVANQKQLMVRFLEYLLEGKGLGDGSGSVQGRP